MSTLRQTSDGDLDLSSKNLEIVRDPAQALALKLQARFRMFLGEWYLDTRLGVPYFQTILVKSPDLNVVEQIFRKVLTNTPGVKSIDTFVLAFDSARRRATFDFRVTTDTGAIIAGGSGTPFIVVER